MGAARSGEGGIGGGGFAKVLMAVAILVVNGALLFFILRFLRWLAFPARKGEPGEAIPTRTRPAAAVNVLGAAAAAEAVEPGAVGQLVYTHPPREAMPVVRFLSGDIVRIEGTSCECGRTSFRMRCLARRDVP